MLIPFNVLMYKLSSIDEVKFKELVESFNYRQIGQILPSKIKRN
ncbi:hypothetical protein M901_1076 [Bacteriovorax sp. DB6_IX]|nr:hypothetical protein M901_1076 [Bacteriovorax sp. DB6_IX]